MLLNFAAKRRDFVGEFFFIGYLPMKKSKHS
jgi:hypothetical protein